MLQSSMLRREHDQLLRGNKHHAIPYFRGDQREIRVGAYREDKRLLTVLPYERKQQRLVHHVQCSINHDNRGRALIDCHDHRIGIETLPTRVNPVSRRAIECKRPCVCDLHGDIRIHREQRGHRAAACEQCCKRLQRNSLLHGCHAERLQIVGERVRQGALPVFNCFRPEVWPRDARIRSGDSHVPDISHGMA